MTVVAAVGLPDRRPTAAVLGAEALELLAEGGAFQPQPLALQPQARYPAALGGAERPGGRGGRGVSQCVELRLHDRQPRAEALHVSPEPQQPSAPERLVALRRTWERLVAAQPPPCRHAGSGDRAGHVPGRARPRPPGTTPLYRLLNRDNGDHFYTASAAERDAAVAQHGYLSEGIACHVFGP